MRELVKRYLDRTVSRRRFVTSTVRTGLSFSAALSLVGSLEPLRGDGGPPDADGGSLQGTDFVGTGGEILARTLQAAGVEYVFTNPGSMERGFFDALLDAPEITVVMGLHEGLVLAMADGYYKASRKPAVVNVHTMVGTAQMLGQLFNAHRDGSAIVVTAGMIDNNVYSDDVINGAPPGYSQNDLPRQITKMSWDVKTPETIPLATCRAFKVALTQPGGPTYIAYPDTVLETKDAKARILPAEAFLIPTRVRPNRGQIEKAAQLLVQARYPVLCVGDEIGKADAQSLAVELAELLALPVVDAAYGSVYVGFPSRHPLYVGEYWAGLDILKGMDLLLAFGGRFFGLSWEGSIMRDDFMNRIPSDPVVPLSARTIQIGLNTSEIGRNVPFDLAIVADPREALADLIAAVKSLLTPARLSAIRESRLDRVRAYTEARRRAALDQARERWDAMPMSSDRFSYEVSRLLDKDAVILSENGAPLDKYMNYGPGAHLSIGGTGGALGWSPGAAIGAQLALPDRQIVCNAGDGAIMYSSAAFWTQARYGTPVLTLVNNNRNYETVRGFFHRYGGKMAASGHYLCTHLGDPDIDYVLLAKSQGVAGERVVSPSEVPDALKRAIKATKDGRPYLVEALVAKRGGGADSTWYPPFRLGDQKGRVP